MTLEIPTKRSYIDESTLPYGFCPGCGHGVILNKLNEAMQILDLDPKRTVIVTDIGCVGLSDKHFITHDFHGLHGRSVTYAQGIKLANPELTVIVLMGDGGTGIGGHHLINAARRNVGVTVLVFDNFNFGMTGGEHSVTTPLLSKTATTRGGNLEQPLDICATVAVNGASFAARATSFDEDLPNIIATAISRDGFSLLDIWELCTAYFVPNNNFSKKLLMSTVDATGLKMGVLADRTDRPEYARAVRERNELQRGQPTLPPKGIEAKFAGTLTGRRTIVLAGSAGQKIRSTAHVLSQAGIYSGLWATQRDDYPITIMTGHSVAEIILSPEDILYTGITRPDVTIIVSTDGLGQVKKKLPAYGPEQRVYIDTELLPIETNAQVIPLDFGRVGGSKAHRKALAMMAVSAYLRQMGDIPLDAFREALTAGQRPEIAKENLEAFEKGSVLLDA